MNWIKAIGGEHDGWWQLALTDLHIVADGESEEAMVQDLAHTLFSHYALAKMHKRTPFVDLLRDPNKTRPEWKPENDHKCRSLNLPDEISQALAAVLHAPNYAQMEVAIGSGNVNGVGKVA